MPKLVSLTPAVFHLPERVRAVARDYEPLPPRAPAFRPLVARVRSGLVRALGADGYEAVLLTGSGSTAMAAVLGSCLAPHERLAVLRNGAYGDRLLELARTIGQPVVDLPVPYGERPDLGGLERVAAARQVDAVAVVYGCTSSCNLNPVAEVAAIARRHGLKLLVDGVSALFVEPFDFPAWGIAAVMGSCNKGLHAHPNLTFALVSRPLCDAMADIAPRAPSLELHKAWCAQREGQHPYTIDPLSLLQVDAALAALEDEGGLAGRRAIYAARAALLRAGYEKLGLEIARFDGMELGSIGTALTIPAGTSYAALADRLATEPFEGHVFAIYSAQGPLSARLFRVFHMGDYPLEVYALFLGALGRALGR
ncbi:MAG: alanine--glyoxylate aminotransferase family protein [Myxococcales bacterium]|nr:alanine--glyoxylate aminotransferase family protein [Myxococcales bacterium]